MNYFTEYKDIKELTRDVVVKLISEVRVSENKEIEIVFDFDDCYKKLLESVEKLGYQVDKEPGGQLKSAEGRLCNMARKSRKNMMLQENTALPDKEKKVLFKAGLYARLSHEKEENIERGTIETQMELMKNYVKDHEDIVIEEEYYDASFTGTNFERPDFKRMLEEQKQEELTVLLLRIYRDLEEIMWRWGTTLKECFLFSM